MLSTEQAKEAQLKREQIAYWEARQKKAILEGDYRTVVQCDDEMATLRGLPLAVQTR